MALIPNLVLKTKPHPCQYCCVNCIYDPETDFGKYGVAYKYGKLRILLEPIGTTMFVCPKCKMSHLSNEFIDGKVAEKLRKRKRKLKIQALKQIYQPVLGEKC